MIAPPPLPRSIAPGQLGWIPEEVRGQFTHVGRGSFKSRPQPPLSNADEAPASFEVITGNPLPERWAAPTGCYRSDVVLVQPRVALHQLIRTRAQHLR